jgi:AcrR family transcriptional regulator
METGEDQGREQTDGFARRREQSKEEIRRAAWALFSRFGVERVSVTDIARKAGVSHGTIYNNFGSKGALVREFVASVIDQLVDRVREVLAPEIPFREKMAAFLALISEMVAHEDASTVDATVFTGSIDLLQDPEIKRIRSAAQERMADLLLALVQEGREQGEIRPAVSDAALRIYFRAYMDLFTDTHLQHQFDHNVALVEELGTLMLHGLTGPSDHDP